MNLKSIVLNILKESPDMIITRFGMKKHNSSDSFAFGYYPNFDYDSFKMQQKVSHWDIFDNFYLDIRYSGRLWFNSKIISFWTYPETRNIFKQIIKDINFYSLENKFRFTVTKSWYVEEIVDRYDGSIKIIRNRNKYPLKLIGKNFDQKCQYKIETVPIEDYLKPLEAEWKKTA